MNKNFRAWGGQNGGPGVWLPTVEVKPAPIFESFTIF